MLSRFRARRESGCAGRAAGVAIELHRCDVEGMPRLLRSVRIALVGLVTKDTKSVATGPFGAAEFEDEEQTLKRLLPQVLDQADVVILLTHCGLEVDRRLAEPARADRRWWSRTSPTRAATESSTAPGPAPGTG